MIYKGDMMRFAKYGFAALILGTAPLAAQTDCEGWSRGNFFETVEADHLRACIAQGETIWTNQSGYTPLHAAAKDNPSPDVIMALIENGADISARDDFGVTPLHFAVRRNPSLGVTMALLDAGADISARDGQGATPLFYALRGGASLDIIMALLGAGADPSALDQYDYAPLHAAARLDASLDIIMALINAGADVSSNDNEFGRYPVDMIDESSPLFGAEVYQLLEAGRGQ